jgi:hypothetical protein
MATIKSFTSLEQSKVLNKILSDESADMVYVPTTDLNGNEYYYVNFRNDEPIFEDCIYAWSLAALLDVLPNKLQIALAINDFQGDRKEKYVIGSVEHDEYDCYADNPVDACYEMIIKLHELKML